MRRIFRSLVLATALACSAAAPASPAVVVSSKLSTESALIGHMIRLLLEAHGIETVDRMTLAGTPIMRRAIIAGMIDLYVEYTGNAAFFFNVATDPAWKDLDRGYALGARLDYAAHRIVWLTPARASNAWAIALRMDVADPQRLTTMSEFGRWVAGGGNVVLACSAEFANSPLLKSLERTYGFALRSDQMIVLAGGDTAATIRAAAERTSGANAAMVYGTDGAVAFSHLRVLDDDRHDQPAYAPVPIIREAVLQAHPQIAAIVEPLMRSFDRETLQTLNARVQINGEPPA